MSVTLIGIPIELDFSMAGTPSAVAGILISTFGRETVRKSSSALEMVFLVSNARSGSTSSDT
jgi:hypothetical protein